MDDIRLIEAGFPCHQVGAETQRERGASSALPPIYFLHVWWARRPLTPSRAAILGSLLPASTDPDWFLCQLGIEKKIVAVNGMEITLYGDILEKVIETKTGAIIIFDEGLEKYLNVEQKQRRSMSEQADVAIQQNPGLRDLEPIQKWIDCCRTISTPYPLFGSALPVRNVSADPAWFNELMAIATSQGFRIPNMYGYDRAYKKQPEWNGETFTVLDPTAGGGSIPYEALRLNCNVISNDLNPVSTVIQYATVDYPFRFGQELLPEIAKYGEDLISRSQQDMEAFFPRIQPLPEDEREYLLNHLSTDRHLASRYLNEDTMTYLYCRMVNCPHCGGEAPLLNTSWLAKDDPKWGVRIVADGQRRIGKVRFEPYRIVKGSRGPNGEDPDFSTVNNGVGLCIHCRQAISSEEIKSQARGESPHGKWEDRLYCVAANRLQPKMDKQGRVDRFGTGKKAGELKTEKIRFFRPPNNVDLDALKAAERELQRRWPEWEARGIIPTERVPDGNDMRPILYGMNRWCDLFTPRQLLCHLTLIERLIELKPVIIRDLGPDRGRAVITYLQFMIDKGLDYNSRQTRWEYTRGIVKGTFGRHDFSLKWTFGEMIYSGPNSGARWGMSQILDAYAGIADLATSSTDRQKQKVRILNGSAASMDIESATVDLVCMDPPYYNNVQYAELSDFFYVWQRRTLGDLYEGMFSGRYTNKKDEAVANPVRDGNAKNSESEYQRLMQEIFTECSRVLKPNGLLTLMFTHKTVEAWEALTRSLIESGWVITSSFPVESESAASMHQKDMASAASSIFLTCRKKTSQERPPAVWSGFGGTGVARQVRDAVLAGLDEFQVLHLKPIDEMVACYGRALRVLSENWPVVDGDELVSPIQAMTEASAVVAQHQMSRLTEGRLKVGDIGGEATMALTLFGMFGLGDFAFDDANNLSKSLNIGMENQLMNYTVEPRAIGVGDAKSLKEKEGTHAPLLRKGSKLRLALPSERHASRMKSPQSEWDVLQGAILAFEEGDLPVLRSYIERHMPNKTQMFLDLLTVWRNEVGDEKAQKTAERMLFGLKGR